jgi:N-acetylglucosamine-6-phosphate deacetylase
LLITNARILTPAAEWGNGWLLTDGARIGALGPGAPPESARGSGAQHLEATGLALLPGFIDLHVHGAMGHEVMDADPAGLQAMARFFAEHGVTAFLPTTWTASREAIRRALKTVADMPATTSGAAILGAHLEGPYLNPEKCGAQAARFIRSAQRDEALEFLDTGVIRLLALAPEFAENEWLIDECARRGLAVSAAHTAATYEQMVAAVGRGLRHATHTFNAMVGLGHHEPGTVGAALALPEIACELIADNIHVHPATMKVMVAAKGPERVILVTDAIRAAGLPEGEYQLDDRVVQVRGGAVRLPNGSLAGSVLTMDAALRNLLRATGLSLREAWPMTSLNAARALGLDSHKGSLAAGKDADLVLLDTTLSVQLTVVAGEVVFRKK